VKVLAVVSDRKDWPLDVEGLEVVDARTYLADEAYSGMRGATVFNLCRSYRYQSAGYYVSLLASARGHKPLPGITTIQDLKSPSHIRLVTEDLDRLIQKSLSPIRSAEFPLRVYFGSNIARRHDTLSLHLFKLFPAPFLRALFAREEKSGRWQLKRILPMAASEIPEEHRPFAVETARRYFGGRRRSLKRKKKARFDLAILYSPGEEGPSNRRAIQRFIGAAEHHGMAAEIVDKDDYGRLAEFDALFIRETTFVNHYTYRFARRAAAEGLVVVDDPESILKCGNKVFLSELLEKHRLPAPKTMIVHRGNARSVLARMELPCVLKKPDSSFSEGVTKVSTAAELGPSLEVLLERSDLVVAQEFLPTEFDWRVGVFDNQPLFVCRYYMAKRHWQIVKRSSRSARHRYGDTETLAVDDAPARVVRTALRPCGPAASSATASMAST
jgi:glutathione synthase/RimK-type ligase-like ATP-grasp enzyme